MDQQPASGPTKKNARAMDVGLAAVLLTASLFILYTYDLRAHPPAIGDAERYIYIATAIKAHDWTHAVNYHYPPLFPALIAAMSVFIPDLESAARLVTILATALTIFPLYFLGLRVFGRKPALVGCAFFAFTFFEQQAIVKAEQPANLLTFLAVLAGLGALESRRASCYLLTGVLFGASFLIKPEAMAYFLMFALIAAIVKVQRGRALPGSIFPGSSAQDQGPRPERRSRAASSLVLLALGYFLLTGPYLASYYHDTGRLSLNPKAHTLFCIHNFLYTDSRLYMIQKGADGYFTQAERTYVEGDKKPPDVSIAQKIMEYPGTMAWTYFWRLWKSREILRDYYLSGMAPVIWPLLLAFGLWPGKDPENRRREFYLHAFAVVPLLSVPLFSSFFPRFYFVLIPWFALVLGRGAARMIAIAAGGARADRRGRVENAALTAAVAALMLSASWKLAEARPDHEYWARIEYRREVAEKLKVLLPEKCRFMAELDSPTMSYLAGLSPERQEITPAATLEGVLAMAVDRHCKFLVFYPSEFQNRYPSLIPLLTPGFTMRGLKRVFRGSDPSGNTYVIYEILPATCGAGPDS